MFRIEQVAVEGFRGINKRVEMSFDSRTPVILLQGDNGRGKTSTLQAIEWCLTGSLLYFAGGDFTREDAIVNLFHPSKKGLVETVLVDEKGTRVVIRRSKKMGKSTGRGGSTLEATIDGETFREEEADSMILKTVFDSLEDPATLFHLHQDSLRQILTADPKERSRAIDRILGTFEIRDFLEAIDVKRKLTLSFKKLETERSALERDKVQVAVATREKLSRQRETLEAKGWKDKLSHKAVSKELRHMREELSTVSKELGHESTLIPLTFPEEMKNEEAQETIKTLQTECQTLDRFRIGAASTIREKRTSISESLEQYSSADGAIVQLGAERSEDAAKKKELTTELEGLVKTITELERTRNLLGEPIRSAHNLDLKLRQVKEQLSTLKSAIGEPDAQRAALEKLRNSLERLQTDLNTFSKQKQLVVIALDFLEISKPDSCPVCTQRIDVNSVIQNLRLQSLDELSKQTEAAMGTLNKTKEELRKLEAERLAYERLVSEDAGLNTQMRKLMLQVQSISGQKLAEIDQLNSMVEALDQKIASASTRRTELDARIQALNERTAITEQSRIMQGNATTKLQKLVSTNIRGQELLSLAKKELERLQTLESKLGEFKQIDQVLERLDALEDTTEYLAGMQELKKLEEEIPRISKIAKDLDKRLEKITHLEASLASIFEILHEHLTRSVPDLLGSLEKTINEYYTTISGHPYFVKMHLEPDPKKPLIYTVKALSDDETLSTYVATRFSSAQMNCAGISLFLAHSEKMLNQLATVMMDDPTQSFDEEHKKGLAKIIKELGLSKQVFVATQDHQFAEAVRRSCGNKVAVWKFNEWSEQELDVTA